MKKINCCNGCLNRNVSCHCTCKNYKEEKEAFEKEKEKIFINNHYYKLWRDYVNKKFSA